MPICRTCKYFKRWKNDPRQGWCRKKPGRKSHDMLYFSMTCDKWKQARKDIAYNELPPKLGSSIMKKLGLNDPWYDREIDLSMTPTDLDEVLKNTEKKIELKPKDAGNWFTKAFILQELGRNEEALKACDKALELKPKHTEALALRSILLCK